jgi:hypothetical protein
MLNSKIRNMQIWEVCVLCDQSDNPGESTKLSVNNTLWASTSSSQQQSLSIGGQAHIAGFGFQGVNGMQTTGKSLSTANT